MIKANGAMDLDGGTRCSALENFQEKYMPFFVEDYRWTSANYANMEQRAPGYAKWWAQVSPLVEAADIGVGCKQGVGLETVEQHMAAIGVGHEDVISNRELISRIFERVPAPPQTRVSPHQLMERPRDTGKPAFAQSVPERRPAAAALRPPRPAAWPHAAVRSPRGPAHGPAMTRPCYARRVFETRLKPVFGSGETALLPVAERRTNGFVRYLAGQCVLFSRFDFVPEVSTSTGRRIPLLTDSCGDSIPLLFCALDSWSTARRMHACRARPRRTAICLDIAATTAPAPRKEHPCPPRSCGTEGCAALFSSFGAGGGWGWSCRVQVAMYGEKVLSFVSGCVAKGGTLTEDNIASVRSLYLQALRVLQQKALITPDDVARLGPCLGRPRRPWPPASARRRLLPLRAPAPSAPSTRRRRW